MKYTIASIKRIKISKENGISIFLEPAVNFKTVIESETSLLFINLEKEIECYKSRDTEFKVDFYCKSIYNLLAYWIDKRSLLKIEVNQYNSKLIKSIEMYEEKR